LEETEDYFIDRCGGDVGVDHWQAEDTRIQLLNRISIFK